MALALGGNRRSSAARTMTAAGDVRAIEQLVALDMLPRLIVAHGAPGGTAPKAEPSIGPEHVERLAELSLQLEAHLLLELVESFLHRGVSPQTLFVELLAPAARQLGNGWVEDRIDFVDVTMGLWRLQEVLRDIASRATRQDAAQMRGSALFLPYPGDQHSFGTAMIHECFGLAGWEADMLIDGTRGQLLDLVAGRSFDLVGLTVSMDVHIEPLPSLIRAVRSVSMNPHIRIIVGGRACTALGGIAAIVGADGTAESASAAVQVADRLIRSARAEAA